MNVFTLQDRHVPTAIPSGLTALPKPSVSCLLIANAPSGSGSHASQAGADKVSHDSATQRLSPGPLFVGKDVTRLHGPARYIQDVWVVTTNEALFGQCLNERRTYCFFFERWVPGCLRATSICTRESTTHSCMHVFRSKPKGLSTDRGAPPSPWVQETVEFWTLNLKSFEYRLDRPATG